MGAGSSLLSLATHATSSRSAPNIQAKRESEKRGQENDPIPAYTPIASNAAPAIAAPFRQALHFACDSAIDSEGELYSLRAGEPSVRQAARALAISAPEALAEKPHDEQEVANGSFGSSQAKQRQRYDRFMRVIGVRCPRGMICTRISIVWSMDTNVNRRKG